MSIGKVTRKKVFLLLTLLLAVSSVAFALARLWPQERTYEESFNFGGIDRTYLLHIPPGYDGTKPVPLVIVLHGATETLGSIEGLTGMTAKSDAEGFIVVYPVGTGGLGGRHGTLGLA